MLIEFSIENFRSFRRRQTLSMVAAPRLQKRDNVVHPDLPGEKFPGLLKTVAIYGPNASGKTSLMCALEAVWRMCIRAPASTTPLPFEPFRFDRALEDKPSKLELHFITGGLRYSFHLSATQERVVEEQLTSYRRGKASVLYTRTHRDGSDHYEFHPTDLEGGPALHETWRKLTGRQTLFLAQAVSNSNEELMQLRVPHTFLANLMIAVNGMGTPTQVSRRLIATKPTYAKFVRDFLAKVDIPVSKVESRLHEEGPARFLLSGNAEFNDMMNKSVETILTHKTHLGEATFDFSEESEGTQNLFGFALPWYLFGEDGGIRLFAVDEIDSSLHPKTVEAMIKMHITSGREGQLIFTTHDTHLMDAKLLRRDQFWFAERDTNGATRLRSAHDFEGRDSEDIEKRYYEGRYRALPQLRED